MIEVFKFNEDIYNQSKKYIIMHLLHSNITSSDHFYWTTV